MENSAVNLKGTEPQKQQEEPIEQQKRQQDQPEESLVEYAKKHPHGTCKNCGKPTFNTDFCSKECTDQFKVKDGKK